MTIRIQKGNKVNDIDLAQYDIGFYGEELDDRGCKAIETLKKNCSRAIKVKYSPDDFKITFDEEEFEIDDIDEKVGEFRKGTCLLDATTLGFVEILALSKCWTPKENLCYLYLEPGTYFRPQGSNILHKRDFELSGQIHGFKAIPGFSALLNRDIEHKIIFILGFESSRVEKAFEDHQMIDKQAVDLIFGFPAFKPGWEMDSFANHVNLIEQNDLIGEIKFGAATDPLATYSIIKKIRDAMNDDTQLFISPLGTKPMAIGAALFVAEHPETAILYDHPEKKTGRSSKTNIWHLYQVDSE